MLAELTAAATAGAFAKLADDYQDKKFRIPPIIATLLSVFYGLILGLLCAYTPLASLFIALAIANALTQKINGIHLFGFAAFAGVLFYAGISIFDPYLFSLFLISSLFDELELKRPKLLVPLFENRLLTPIAALIVLIHSSQIIFFAAIVSFDVLYKLTNFLIDKRLEK